MTSPILSHLSVDPISSIPSPDLIFDGEAENSSIAATADHQSTMGADAAFGIGSGNQSSILTIVEDSASLDSTDHQPPSPSSGHRSPVPQIVDISSQSPEMSTAHHPSTLGVDVAFGIDLGDQSTILAIKKDPVSGIDVIFDHDDFSRHNFSSSLFFLENQIEYGASADDYAFTSPEHYISQLKRLVGTPYCQLRQELDLLPFDVIEGSDGFPLIIVRYKGENRRFSPTHLLSLVFLHLKRQVKKKLKMTEKWEESEGKDSVKGCCIGVPVYFTDLQRQCVSKAAEMAGLIPLQLMHETTAAALAYRFYRKQYPTDQPIHVLFVDIGLGSTQVSIARYMKSHPITILAHSFDRSIGGRDFDEVLVEMIAAMIKEEFKKDVFENRTARFLLRKACEELKKVLSANPEGSFEFRRIDCAVRVKIPLIEALEAIGLRNKVLGGSIKMIDFEAESFSLLERIETILGDALAQAGMKVDNIDAIELVGFGSRVPQVLKALTEFFGKAPRRTIAGRGGVAKGLALRCEMMSSTSPVMELLVAESFPWRGCAQGLCHAASLTWLPAPKRVTMRVSDSTYEDLSATEEILRDAFDENKQDTSDRLIQMLDYVKYIQFMLRQHKYAYEVFRSRVARELLDEAKSLENDIETLIFDDEDLIDDVTTKFENLKKIYDSLDKQCEDYVERGILRKRLEHCVTIFEKAAVSADPLYDHINHLEKQSVLEACKSAKALLSRGTDLLEEDGPPQVVDLTELRKEIDVLVSHCRRIFMKPKQAQPRRTPLLKEQPVLHAFGVVGISLAATIVSLLLRRFGRVGETRRKKMAPYLH